MTTLELARRMAVAARAATDEADAARAVLGVLHDTRSWLTRVREDAAGLTVEVHYEQAELFPTYPPLARPPMKPPAKRGDTGGKSGGTGDSPAV